MPTSEPEVRQASARRLGERTGRAYKGGMGRVIKYALVGIVLSVLLTPVIGMGIVIVAAIVRSRK